MATYAHPIASRQSSVTEKWRTRAERFLNDAQFNRFGWDVTLLSVQSLLSFAVLVSVYYGQGADWQFLVAILSFMAVLAPVLSAQSMRFLFLSAAVVLLIQVAIILMNVL